MLNCFATSIEKISTEPTIIDENGSVSAASENHTKYDERQNIGQSYTGKDPENQHSFGPT